MFIPPAPRTEETLLWYMVDFDLTLATSDPKNGFKPTGVIEENIYKYMELINNGYKCKIHTARHWADVEMIEEFMKHYNLPHHGVICGKPLAKRYVDDKAINADAETWLP